MDNLHITTAVELFDTIARVKPVAVLSIEHPGAQGDGRAPRLDPKLGIIQRIQVYWDTEDPKYQRSPGLREVRSALEFLKKYTPKGDVIIHCRAGKARSPAVALAFMAASQPGKIDEAMARLKIMRPQAAPNILIIALADHILKLDGALKKAVLNDPFLTVRREMENAARQRWAEKNPPLLLRSADQRARYQALVA